MAGNTRGVVSALNRRTLPPATRPQSTHTCQLRWSLAREFHHRALPRSDHEVSSDHDFGAGRKSISRPRAGRDAFTFGSQTAQRDCLALESRVLRREWRRGASANWESGVAFWSNNRRRSRQCCVLHWLDVGTSAGVRRDPESNVLWRREDELLPRRETWTWCTLRLDRRTEPQRSRVDSGPSASACPARLTECERGEWRHR